MPRQNRGDAFQIILSSVEMPQKCSISGSFLLTARFLCAIVKYKMTEMRNDYRGRVNVENFQTFFASGKHGKEVRSDGNGGALVRGYYWKMSGKPGCVGPYNTRKFAEQVANVVLTSSRDIKEMLRWKIVMKPAPCFL